MASYLAGRIGDLISNKLPITFHVPQGSILDSTLFLAYINDLCNIQRNNDSIFTFADDTALIFYGDFWKYAFNYAQLGFNYVSTWVFNNLLTFDVGNTMYLIFSLIIVVVFRPPLCSPLLLIPVRPFHMILTPLFLTGDIFMWGLST